MFFTTFIFIALVCFINANTPEMNVMYATLDNVPKAAEFKPVTFSKDGISVGHVALPVKEMNPVCSDEKDLPCNLAEFQASPPDDIKLELEGFAEDLTKKLKMSPAQCIILNFQQIHAFCFKEPNPEKIDAFKKEVESHY